MHTVKIGYDKILGKDIVKLKYNNNELPKVQLFNSSDVIVGNPSSNIAIAFVYTWKTDSAPKEIKELLVKLSNYSALTGFWRTTNGAKYVFSNLLANPNINKLVVLCFGAEDNGHLVIDSLTNFWQNGVNEEGIIKNSKSPNPRFEQVNLEALERLKKQVDLVVCNNIIEKDYEKIEELLKALIQEPENAVDSDKFDAKFYSNVIKNNKFYDDGARFQEPYMIDLSITAKNISFVEKNLISTVGQSLQANNLDDAIEQIASFVFKNGSALIDERNIITIESRSITITILNPLEKIPDGFSKEYIEKYTDEFMNGRGEKLDEFAYTYHDRIFKKWGNQVDKIIEVLKKRPNTRRTMISLWDPKEDLENTNPPCLDFIWVVVRNNKLEFHIVYRSHHIATVTKEGKLMKGEGAFVPNLFALAKLQEKIAKELNISSGPLVLTDFSGHLYVSDVD